MGVFALYHRKPCLVIDLLPELIGELRAELGVDIRGPVFNIIHPGRFGFGRLDTDVLKRITAA